MNWLLIFFLIFIHLSCDKKYPTNKMNAVFSKNYEFSISDTLGIHGAIIHLEQINDSIIVFNDFLRSAIFKTNINSKITIQIGKNGSGPGEYITPYRFDVVNDTIFFTDLGDFNITLIDINGNYISEIPLKKTYSLISTLNGDIYGVVPIKNTHYLFKNSNPLAFEIPIGFSSLTEKTLSPIGLEIFDNKIYFMNGYEAKIFCYDLTNNLEGILELPLEFNENKIRWSEYYENVIPKLKYSVLSEKDSPFVFYTIAKINGQIIHIISGTDNQNNWIYLINEKGEITNLIKLKDYVFHSIYNSNFLFVRKDENGEIFFSNFKIK